MKKLLKLAFFLALMPFIFLASCNKEDDDPAVNSYPALKAYMINHNLDLPALMNGWIKDPKTLATGGVVDSTNSTIPNYHVFDIRSAADFAVGHISGAHNVALKDVLDSAVNYTSKPILVVCYTGQTAGQAVMALRLAGYSSAAVLKWGMAGWNANFQAPWVSNSGWTTPANGNIAVGNANWVTTAAPQNLTFAEPNWTSGTTDTAALLIERIKSVLANGFKNVTADAVLTNPAAYQVVNYWPVADYTNFGHYTGSYNLPVISLANDLNKSFDPARENAVYCYTGQTSSMVTFWMNVLGYNAKGVLFAGNRLVYDQLSAAGKTVFKGPKNWAVVTK